MGAANCAAAVTFGVCGLGVACDGKCSVPYGTSQYMILVHVS